MNRRDEYLIEQDNKNFFKKFRKNGKKRNKKNKPSEYKSYREYLQSKRWGVIRSVVLKRANFICELCTTDKAIQVHHITYKRIFKENFSDLVAICNDCHKRIHDIF